MNTHSNDSDSRLELLIAAIIKLALREGMNFILLESIVSKVLEQKTTTGAIAVIKENRLEKCFDIIANQMLYYSYNRAFKAEIFFNKNRFANINEFKNSFKIRIVSFSDNVTIIDTGDLI